jgi:hypothetical protein
MDKPKVSERTQRSERKDLHQRLLDILRRHVRYPQDGALSDLDFVNAVHGRFVASRDDYILDPNE